MELFFSNLLSVADNVFVLFLLIAVGFVTNKTGILNDGGAKCLSNLALLIVNPCVIIKSFLRAYDPDLLGRYILLLLVTLALQGGMAVLLGFMLRDKDEAKERVYRFAVLFSNAGYMAIPLQQAILGDEGVFFGSAYIASFNIFLWTYGVVLMGGKDKKISLSKVFVNPGVISVAIGMVLFICSVPVPSNVSHAVDYVAGLNTALPMMIIGYYFANANIIQAVKNLKSYYCLFLRLILFPVLCVGILWLLGIRGTEFVSTAIALSAPAAAATTMFASRYNGDVELSAQLVSFSTLVSIVTMPVIVACSMFLS